MSDKRHGDPEHGGLSAGEKAAVTRQVRAGQEVHLPGHPEHAEAAKAYAQEVAAREGGTQKKGQAGGHAGGTNTGGSGHKGGAAHTGGAAHHRGELSGAEKAAVTRQVHSGGRIEDIPFTQNHPRKLQEAQEYAEQVKTKEGGA